MTYELHMNGVITGSMNSFCLACRIFSNSQQEATEHIGTPEHRQKLDAVPYAEKFQGDHIKKFKDGYYCEFCNVLMPIATKVNLHINEDGHKHNKGILLLKPFNGDVVAFNKIIIEEKAWHGLIDGVCSLCNEEFDDETEHKTDASHSLNLILKPIQFEADNAIIRRLDDTVVQCLICNKLLAPGRMTKHFDDTEHQELYAKRRVQSNERLRLATEDNCQKDATNKSSLINICKILDSIDKYPSEGININLETEIVFCKKCSKIVKFDYMEIENHIGTHLPSDFNLKDPSKLDQNLNRGDINNKSEPSPDGKQNTQFEDKVENTAAEVASHKEDKDVDPPVSDDFIDIPKIDNIEKYSQEEEARDFAKVNKINYIGSNSLPFCSICQVYLPVSLKCMREHVDGTNHRRLAASVTQAKTLGKHVKLTSQEYITSVTNSPFFISCIINKDFCILRDSYSLISVHTSRRRCLVCEINLPLHLSIEDHTKSPQHQAKWQKVPVITSERREFIREIHPGMFHCGYCNTVTEGWMHMKLHLHSSGHRKNRNIGEGRLRLKLATIQHCQKSHSS